MNLPRVYMCSPSWNPLLPPLPAPSLWVIPGHQHQTSCILHWTWTGDSFLIWYYTCFSAILPNHATLTLSHRVQKTVLYICLFCSLVYRVIVTVFLNSIYMRKFGLGIWNEARQRLIEFCQENALVIANTLFQQRKRRLHMDITRWLTPKSDWLYSMQPKMEKLYTVNKNKTRSWLWLRSWTPYYQIHTQIEESGENC